MSRSLKKGPFVEARLGYRTRAKKKVSNNLIIRRRKK